MDSHSQNIPNENNFSQNKLSRKGKGRQKVDMVKIKNETNLQVTFSKRRAGLFKKASELSTLCGAESAVIVFSPGNKVYSFGKPSVEEISNRFLNQDTLSLPRSNTNQLQIDPNDMTMHQCNRELTCLEDRLEQEQKHKKKLEEMKKTGEREKWCPPSLDKLNYEQLDQLKKSVTNFKNIFESKVQSATNFQKSYVQGTSLNSMVQASLPWENPNGLSIGFGSNVQGTNDNLAPFNGNQEAMFTNNAPLSLGGSFGGPNMMHGGSSNATFPSNLGINDGFGFCSTHNSTLGNYGSTTQEPYPYNHGVGILESSSIIPPNIPMEGQGSVFGMPKGFLSNYENGN